PASSCGSNGTGPSGCGTNGASTTRCCARSSTTWTCARRECRPPGRNGARSGSSPQDSFDGRIVSPLHRRLDEQALAVAIDRGHRLHPARLTIRREAVTAGDVALDLDRVPPLRVPDVRDRHVIVLAPEEGDGAIGFARAEHRSRRVLPVTLGHHPVLDADRPPAARVG